VVVVMWDLMVSLFASGSLLMISARVSSSPDSNTSRISAWVMHVFLSVMIYSIVAKTTCMTTSTRVPIASDLHKRLKKEAIDRDMTLQSLVTEILSAHFDKTTSATVPQKPKGQSEKTPFCREGVQSAETVPLSKNDDATAMIRKMWARDPRPGLAEISREIDYKYQTVDSWVRRNLLGK